MSSTATAVGTVKRFWAMNGPVLPMPTGLLVLGGEGMVDCPFPTFLIEHEKGLVLLDTGLRPQAPKIRLARTERWAAPCSRMASIVTSGSTASSRSSGSGPRTSTP